MSSFLGLFALWRHESTKSAESANVFKERQKPICMKKKVAALDKRMEWKTKEEDGSHS